MTRYRYRVVPAPAKGLKAKGLKGPDARFANAIEQLLNEMAADGWEYQRAETLPSDERQGLTGSHTVFRNLLVFRQPDLGVATAFDARALTAARSHRDETAETNETRPEDPDTASGSDSDADRSNDGSQADAPAR